MDIKDAIRKVVDFKDLTEDEMRSVFETIMSGEATSAQIGAFITALRMKKETVEEITAAAIVMREKAVKIKVPAGKTVLDTCGTGGSGSGVFNVSTAVAFVLAASGVKVAKHGNRAASSKCGSADVLEILGVKIDVSPEITEKCIQAINIGFMFAPLYHGAMKYAITPRKEIGIRTVFNIIGPLSNPALATCQVLGVYDGSLTEIMANVLGRLGTTKAYVVHGLDGLDEVTIEGETKISELSEGKVKSYKVSPDAFGVKGASISEVKGGSAEENAGIIKSVLSGSAGPKRDIVLINASMALMVTDKVKSFEEGASFAAEIIDSGKAAGKLEELISMTNK